MLTTLRTRIAAASIRLMKQRRAFQDGQDYRRLVDATIVEIADSTSSSHGLIIGRALWRQMMNPRNIHKAVALA